MGPANLRLDFLILGGLAGPSILGTYAIASKFAELLKILPMALTYVLYPRYANQTRSAAAAGARELLPRAAATVALAAVPLWLAATYLLPIVYGRAFRPAIEPAHILLFGLAAEGVAGVITAFLYGIGRPGLNSIAMGAGVVVTVALDLLLSSRVFLSEEAKELGIVNRVVPGEQLMDETLAYAKDLAANCSPAAIDTTRGERSNGRIFACL